MYIKQSYNVDVKTTQTTVNVYISEVTLHGISGSNNNISFGAN